MFRTLKTLTPGSTRISATRSLHALRPDVQNLESRLLMTTYVPYTSSENGTTYADITKPDNYILTGPLTANGGWPDYFSLGGNLTTKSKIKVTISIDTVAYPAIAVKFGNAYISRANPSPLVFEVNGNSSGIASVGINAAILSFTPPSPSGAYPYNVDINIQNEDTASSSPPPPPVFLTPTNIQELATVIMSEASIGNTVEQTAVGWTVRNRMVRNGTTKVSDVWSAYVHNQSPKQPIITLATSILSGAAHDPTGGGTHYYSPRALRVDQLKLVKTIVNGQIVYTVYSGKVKQDVLKNSNGIPVTEQTSGLPVRNYIPTWASGFIPVNVAGSRPAYFKFFKAPGTGPVK